MAGGRVQHLGDTVRCTGLQPTLIRDQTWRALTFFSMGVLIGMPDNVAALAPRWFYNQCMASY